MSKLQNDLEKIDLSDCGNLKATVQKLVASEAVEDFLRRLADRSKFTEFSTKHHGFSQATASNAIDIFIETGDLRACENFILSNYDSSDVLHDLIQDTMNSVGYTNLIESVSRRAAKRFPESAQRLENLVVDVVLDQLINMIKAKDKSRPLDLLRNAFVTVAYLPVQWENGQEMPSTSAITSEQDCISVIPNDILKSFLQAANVDKKSWIDAVESHIDMRLDSDENPLKDMWQKARWTVQGRPVIDVARLVEAVDACRYGFTPLVAFSIDAYKFVTRDWQRGFSVTGGVIGLHDFRYGSGAPLRFEGTVEIIARPQDFIQPEKKMYGLSESHGFTNISYLSKIRETNRTHVDRPSSVNCIDVEGWMDQYSLCSENGDISEYEGDWKDDLTEKVIDDMGNVIEHLDIREKSIIHEDVKAQIDTLSKGNLSKVAAILEQSNPSGPKL